MLKDEASALLSLRPQPRYAPTSSSGSFPPMPADLAFYAEQQQEKNLIVQQLVQQKQQNYDIGPAQHRAPRPAASTRIIGTFHSSLGNNYPPRKSASGRPEKTVTALPEQIAGSDVRISVTFRNNGKTWHRDFPGTFRLSDRKILQGWAREWRANPIYVENNDKRQVYARRRRTSSLYSIDRFEAFEWFEMTNNSIKELVAHQALIAQQAPPKKNKRKRIENNNPTTDGQIAGASSSSSSTSSLTSSLATATKASTKRNTKKNKTTKRSPSQQQAMVMQMPHMQMQYHHLPLGMQLGLQMQMANMQQQQQQSGMTGMAGLSSMAGMPQQQHAAQQMARMQQLHAAQQQSAIPIASLVNMSTVSLENEIKIQEQALQQYAQMYKQMQDLQEKRVGMLKKRREQSSALQKEETSKTPEKHGAISALAELIDKQEKLEKLEKQEKLDKQPLEKGSSHQLQSPQKKEQPEKML